MLLFFPNWFYNFKLCLSVNTTHVFVSSEENLKFEVSEVRNVQPAADPLSTTQTNTQNPQPQKPCEYEPS